MRLFCVLLALGWTHPAVPCTAFLGEAGGTRIVAKGYDWHQGQGVVLVNRKGVVKQAMPLVTGDRPARWTSRHASVTFNQYGRELPNGGMNDAGLVVEVLWLETSRYAPRDDRPTVNELQWVQYQLDTRASTAEVVAGAAQLRVSPVNGRVHYFVCDRTGDCAVLEWVDGRRVVTSGKSLEAKALTNSTYAASLRYAKHGSDRGRGSLARFARAARAARARLEGDAPEAAFAVLDSVSLGERTQWNLVYVPETLRVYFRTRKSPRVKHLDLGAFEHACGGPVLGVDIDLDAAGEIGERLAPFDTEANQRLVARSLSSIEKQLPPGTSERLARYPETLVCAP